MSEVRSWPLTREGPLGAWCAYVLWLERNPLPQAHAHQALVVSLLVESLVHGPLPETANGVRLPEPLVAATEAVGRVWAESRGPVPIGLERQCTAAAVSRRRLCRLASEEFGMGPVSAVETVRLTRVASLLDQSDMSVAAVAHACGYASPFHLSRRFGHGSGCRRRCTARRHGYPASRCRSLPVVRRRCTPSKTSSGARSTRANAGAVRNSQPSRVCRTGRSVDLVRLLSCVVKGCPAHPRAGVQSGGQDDRVRAAMPEGPLP
ncbi:helix-turn-helix transcriptional regulator [Streptomyces sp. NPDC059651]|uniref:helix-turn-helix transcriptional regulator n=1 Tax=Streptomyces sp. NPDC059651 TaxID=3346897 RepID=UPI0036B7A32B